MTIRGTIRRRRDGLDCMAVGRVLQAALDAEVDDTTIDRVADHLEDCLRCGLEAETYLKIKASLAARAGTVEVEATDRLRRFGQALAAGRIDVEIDEPAGPTS